MFMVTIRTFISVEIQLFMAILFSIDYNYVNISPGCIRLRVFSASVIPFVEWQK